MQGNGPSFTHVNVIQEWLLGDKSTYWGANIFLSLSCAQHRIRPLSCLGTYLQGCMVYCPKEGILQGKRHA